MPSPQEAALAIIGDIFAKAAVVADLAHAMEAETPQPPSPEVEAEAKARPTLPTPEIPPPAIEAAPAPPAQPQLASQQDVLAALLGRGPTKQK